MAGFTSFDDYVSEITNGTTPKILSQVFNKITGSAAYTGNRWYDTFTLAGWPAAGNLSQGTTLAFQSCSDTTTGAIYLGGNKSPDKRHLVFSEITATSANSAPTWYLIVDVLGYYPALNANTSVVQTTNSSGGVNVLPNRDGVQDNGVGVMAFLEVTSTLGATLTTLATVTYTNSAGTLGHQISGQTINLLASAIVPHIPHHNTQAGSFAPFLPLQQGDLGITSIQDIRLAVNTGGGFMAAILARPLFWVPHYTQYLPGGRDGVFNVPIMPRVPDGACLAVLHCVGNAVNASTTIIGFNTLAWG